MHEPEDPGRAIVVADHRVLGGIKHKRGIAHGTHGISGSDGFAATAIRVNAAYYLEFAVGGVMEANDRIARSIQGQVDPADIPGVQNSSVIACATGSIPTVEQFHLPVDPVAD